MSTYWTWRGLQFLLAGKFKCLLVEANFFCLPTAAFLVNGPPALVDVSLFGFCFSFLLSPESFFAHRPFRFLGLPLLAPSFARVTGDRCPVRARRTG
jgi:hypothetical protein